MCVCCGCHQPIVHFKYVVTNDIYIKSRGIKLNSVGSNNCYLKQQVEELVGQGTLHTPDLIVLQRQMTLLQSKAQGPDNRIKNII